MDTCPISPIEGFKEFLSTKKAQRICCIHARGLDNAEAVLAAVEHLEEYQGRVRVVCASDATAVRMGALLDGRADVTTAKSLAISIISDERVQEAIGRRARMLDANEMDVLMEDLKVTGLKHRRLREMMKFFFKSLSDGTAREQGWLITGEEQRQFAVLEENLEARGALLPCEISGKALEGLSAVPDAIRPLPTVALDFGALSALSQELVQQTSGGTVIALGCAEGAPRADEPYPCYKGFLALAEREDVVAVELQSECATPEVSNAVASTPSDEFEFVSNQVARLIAQGCPAEKILVATPNGIWSSHIARHLKKLGVTCRIDGGARKTKGDPRDLASSVEIEAATLTKLRNDPTDMTALRTWLGLGDWLLRSDAFLELLAWAREHDLTVAEALQTLRSTPDEAAKTHLFHKFADRLDALEAALAKPAEAQVDDNTARDSNSTCDGPAVTIAPYDRCPGRIADHVFVTGLVNGFLPHLDAVDDAHTIDRKKLHLERDRELFDDLMAIARVSVALSRFERDAAANAEHLPMQVGRIYQSGDTRMVRVNASLFMNNAS